jgi:hypothetical protein
MKLKLLAITAALCFLLGGCAPQTPEQKFWHWFKDNESSLYDFEKDQARTFDRLSAALHKVNPNLTFEFGPKKNGRRDFVISADGIRGAFPAVEGLYASAPPLPHWNVIKFRPRRDPMDISVGGVTVKAETVLVEVIPNSGKADLTVIMPGYAQETSNAYKQIGYLMLDQALGEYDVETRIGAISFVATPVSGNKTAVHLEQLPKVVDAALASK